MTKQLTIAMLTALALPAWAESSVNPFTGTDGVLTKSAPVPLPAIKLPALPEPKASPQSKPGMAVPPALPKDPAEKPKAIAPAKEVKAAASLTKPVVVPAKKPAEVAETGKPPVETKQKAQPGKEIAKKEEQRPAPKEKAITAVKGLVGTVVSSETKTAFVADGRGISTVREGQKAWSEQAGAILHKEVRTESKRGILSDFTGTILITDKQGR